MDGTFSFFLSFRLRLLLFLLLRFYSQLRSTTEINAEFKDRERERRAEVNLQKNKTVRYIKHNMVSVYVRIHIFCLSSHESWRANEHRKKWNKRIKLRILLLVFAHTHTHPHRVLLVFSLSIAAHVFISFHLIFMWRKKMPLIHLN